MDERSLATFPEEFRQGMAARAGDPRHDGRESSRLTGWATWEVPIFTRLSCCLPATSPNASGADWSTKKHLSQCDGVEVLSSLDLEAIPPFTYAHEHFGYRDRLSQPVIEGMASGTDARFGSAHQGWRILSGLS